MKSEQGNAAIKKSFLQIRKLLIVLTDGSQTRASGAKDPGNIARKIAASGTEVLVIGIGRGVNKKELDHMAGGNAYIVSSFDELISKAFMDRISAAAASCAPGKNLRVFSNLQMVYINNRRIFFLNL